MLYIKITLIIIAILGLLLSLGEMLGFFRDKDRTNFAKIMKEKLQCPKDHPGAKKFINDFVSKNPKYKDIDVNIGEIEKVIFVGLWLGNSNNETGRHVDSVASGSLKIRNIHGQVSESLCSFEELKNWSKEAPFWKWLGWSIVAISIFLGIILLVIEEIVKRQCSL